jgi:hypothetical protein
VALLGQVQRLFERTYGRPAGVDLEACVVGPRRFAELASRSENHPEMSDWARFFFYVEGADLRLALFYAEEMIETLEARDPRRGLSESNVLPLLVFTEEASHALHTTYAFGEGGPGRVSGEEFLAELELMARIDAYLLLRHFVGALVRRLAPSDLAWVRHQALTRWDVPYDDPEMADRYRGTAGHGVRGSAGGRAGQAPAEGAARLSRPADAGEALARRSRGPVRGARRLVVHRARRLDPPSGAISSRIAGFRGSGGGRARERPRGSGRPRP